MSGRSWARVHMRFIHYLSMAFETDRNRLLHQQRHLICRMGVVAARAAHGEGGMDILFAEVRLVVARVADLWRSGFEQSGVVR